MCNRRFCLIVLMVVGFIAFPTAIHAQIVNLALNSSFEEDEVIQDDPAWEQWCTWGYEGGLQGRCSIDETEAIDGTRSLRIEPKGGTNWYYIVLYMPIPTQVNTRYTASFWVKAEAPRSLSAKWKATDNTIDWDPVDFQVTAEWAEYHMSAAAKSGETKLEFHCAAVDTPFWLDFLNVYEGEYVAGIEPSATANRGKALHPMPDDGATNVARDVILGWTAGEFAAAHDVYLGTSFTDVNEADEATATGVLVAQGQAGPCSGRPISSLVGPTTGA